jgi:hypothetical protein
VHFEEPCEENLVCEVTCGSFYWQGRMVCRNGTWEGVSRICESQDRFLDAGDGSIAIEASIGPSDAASMDAN